MPKKFIASKNFLKRKFLPKKKFSQKKIQPKLFSPNCQAQLQLSAQLKAELVLFPLDPATHPPTRESLFLSPSYSYKHSGHS